MRSLGTHGLFWLARAEGCSRLLPLGFPSSSLGLPCVFFQLDAARASPDARAVWQAPWLAMPHAGTLSAKLKWSRARVARCVHCSARVERLQRQRTEPASAVAGALKVLPSRARASSPSRRTLPGANAGWPHPRLARALEKLMLCIRRRLPTPALQSIQNPRTL